MTAPSSRRPLDDAPGLLSHPAALVGLAGLGALLAGTTAGLADPRPTLGLLALLSAWSIVVYSRVALFALAAVTWLNLSDVAITYHGLPSIDKPLVALVLVGIGIRWWWRREVPRLDAPLTLMLILYGCSVALSAFVATDVPLVVGELADLAKNVAELLLVTVLVRDWADVRLLVWALVLAGLVLGVTSAAQLLAGQPDWTFGGLARTMQAQIVGSYDSLRLTGPLDDPNSFAEILVPLVPLAWDRLRQERRVGARVVAGVGMAAVLTALVGTYSRSGLVTLAVVVVALVLLWHRRRALVLAAGAALLLAVSPALLPQGYIDRATELQSFTSGDQPAGKVDPALAGRHDEMLAALVMGLEHPVLGVGIDHYPEYFQTYLGRFALAPRFEDRQAHSLYLETFAERGIIGLAAFLALCVMAFRRGTLGSRALRDAGRISERSTLQAVLLSLAAYLTFAVVLHRNYEHYFWLLLAAVFAAARVAEDAAAQQGGDTAAHV